MSGFRYYRLINAKIYGDSYVTSAITMFIDTDGEVASVGGTAIESTYWFEDVSGSSSFNYETPSVWHQGVPKTLATSKEYIGYISPTPYLLSSVDYQCRPDETRQRWTSIDVEYSLDGIEWFYYGHIDFDYQNHILEVQRAFVQSDLLSALQVNKTSYFDDDYYTYIDGGFLEIERFGIPSNRLYLYETKKNIMIKSTYISYDGLYKFKGLNINKRYHVVDSFGNKIYDTNYEGKENIKGFVEGLTEPIKVILTDGNGNELESQTTVDFEFKNYNIANLKGNIKIGDTLTPIEYFQTQDTKGYISASVSVVDCVDSEFVIHCFRNSDKQFIGEYEIIDGRYTIDNLNLNQTYDIMLYDNNSSLETQVHSRRTPSVYQ